jgi:hypothetical protein
MTVQIGGSSPQITFADSTVQNTAFTGLNSSATPFTTSLGYQAANSTTGVNNTAIGYQAVYTNITGANITALGYQALYSNTASNNTAVGYLAMNNNNTGTDNVGMGTLVMNSNTTGSSNVAIGRQALQANTTASYNTAVGYQAAYSNTTGQANISMGHRALYSATTADGNTAIGYLSATANTTGANNTALGYQALYSNTTTSNNTAVGYQASLNSTGGQNTTIGTLSGSGASFSGAYNTFLGYNSGSAITSGTRNTIIGAYSGNQGGLDIHNASNYIVLSDGDGNPRSYFGVGPFTASYSYWYQTNGIAISSDLGLYNQIWLKNTGSSGASSYFQLFQNSAGTTAGYIAHNGSTTVQYATSSDYRLKENVQPMVGALEKVMQLNPVTYTWKEDGTSGQGFIAHELQAVVPDCVNGEKDAVDKQGNPEYQGIDTSFLVATLTAAIKELNATIQAQATEIAALKSKVGI